MRPKHEFGHNLQGATPEQTARGRSGGAACWGTGPTQRARPGSPGSRAPEGLGGRRAYMWFPISGEQRVHVAPCAQTGAGWKCLESEQDVIFGGKSQSDLGVSWGRGKFLGAGTVQRPGQGSGRAGFRQGLVRGHAPFLQGSLGPPLRLPSASPSVLPPWSQVTTGYSPRTQLRHSVAEAQGGLCTSVTQTGSSPPVPVDALPVTGNCSSLCVPVASTRSSATARGTLCRHVSFLPADRPPSRE